MGISTEKLVEHIANILHDFPKEGYKKLKFEGNNMSEDIFRKIYVNLSYQPNLFHLEITYNKLTTEALELLARNVFTENRLLRIINLSNNYIGGGPRESDCMTIFLENFLLELDTPE